MGFPNVLSGSWWTPLSIVNYIIGRCVLKYLGYMNLAPVKEHSDIVPC